MMNRFKQLILAAAVSLPVVVSAQGLSSVTTGASADLEKALAELSALQKQIEAERIPLGKEITSLEQKVATRKADFTKTQRSQENQLVELNALKTDAKRQADEVKYVETLVAEYGRAFRSRLNFAEEPRYKAMFDTVDKTAGSADLTSADKFAGMSELLITALTRTEAALGGEIIDGQAVDKQGLVQKGKIAILGPVAVFASTSGGAAGVLQQELNKSEPTVFPFEEKQDAAGRALVTSGKGDLMLDPTLGNAFKLSALEKSLVERLKEGGLAMIPLLVLGVASVLVALFKWIQLARVRLVTERDLQTVLNHVEKGEKEAAVKHAKTIKGMAGDLLATAVEHMDEKKEYIEEIVYEKMLGARTKLERGIAFLALTATTGPLFGLLGTVTGMIATFKLISSFGSGDPKLLAAGISEALICTATGMAVAIPALLSHAFLSRKAKGIIGSMEQTAVGFINGIPQSEGYPFS